MPSVMADDNFKSGVRAFKNRVGGKRRRDKHRASHRAGLFHRFGNGVKNGNFFAAVLEKLPAFAGRDTGDDLRAIVNRKLRVFRAKAAGDALNENLGVGFDENGHG